MHPLPRSRPSLVLFLAFYFFLAPFPSSLATTPFCHPDEAIALLQFKHSFSVSSSSFDCALRYDDGAIFYTYVKSYPKTKSWKEGTNCCKWEGVSCDNVTGHIIGLDLSCSQLYGSFPPNSTLVSLPHLRSLNLAWNDFNNSKIPRELSRLTALNHLDLYASSFHREVPSEISHLSNLVRLDLSANNQLQMERDAFRALVQNLSRIRDLILDGADMSSTEVGLFSNLSSALAFLSAIFCSLEGRFPEGMFSRLPQLESISLSGNDQLTGKLPDSIGQYSNSLIDLNLDSCGFGGPIPKSLGNLSELTTLELRSCSFWGPIPESLGNLSELTALELSDNYLTGHIPNFLGTKLQNIFLGHNKLHGSIPSSIYEQSDLVNLDLSSNNFSGLLDFYRLSKLQNLYYLGLGDSTFTFNTSGTITFPSLERLLMPSVGITEFPTFLYRSNNLETLDLSNNKIRCIPQWMYDVSKDSLTILNLSYNFIKVLDRLPWKNIMVLDINSNSLQGVLPPLPSRLQLLSLSNNSLFGEIPSSICNATSLEILDLSHNMFNATIPGCLFNSCNELLVLNLGRNNMKGIIPTTFAKGCQLEFLGLNENLLEGTLPASISHCKGIQVLNLATNLLNDLIPSWVEVLPMLQVLILRSNKFHGWLRTSPKHKHPFQKLQILDLSHNQFSGLITKKYVKNLKSIMYPNDTLKSPSMYMEDDKTYPYKFSVSLMIKGSEMELEKILTVLASIDLSHNRFSGEIPKDIGKLRALKGLNLSHNSLSGQIPPSLGDLKNLEGLDLSSNKLTGQIPMELVDLTFLSTLNLSSNELRGRIPQGKQFNTFSNGSYAGNTGLCGFPLTKQCLDSKGEGPQPDVVQQPADDFAHNVIEWKAVLMGYACGVSFGISLACFVFKNGNPKWFLKLVQFVRIKRHG